jgi:hypothetical protein
MAFGLKGRNGYAVTPVGFGTGAKRAAEKAKLTHDAQSKTDSIMREQSIRYKKERDRQRKSLPSSNLSNIRIPIR